MIEHLFYDIISQIQKFIVVREFSGEKTMQEAFEQLIERQTCEHFEEWLERKAS